MNDQQEEPDQQEEHLLTLVDQMFALLVEAAHEADIERIQIAVDAGIDVNAVSSDGDTLLMAAASGGDDVHPDAQLACVQYLLDSGANPNLGGSAVGLANPTYIFRPLHFAATAEVATLLIEGGADLEGGGNVGPGVRSCSITPYMSAVARGNLAVARTLLRAGADFDARDQADRDAETAAREWLEAKDPATVSAERLRKMRAVLAFVSSVAAAGSWKRYCREPTVKLLALRQLCLRGRAAAPCELARLFGGSAAASAGVPGRTRSKRAAAARGAALPDEVFGHVLRFWDGNLE